MIEVFCKPMWQVGCGGAFIEQFIGASATVPVMNPFTQGSRARNST